MYVYIIHIFRLHASVFDGICHYVAGTQTFWVWCSQVVSVSAKAATNHLCINFRTTGFSVLVLFENNTCTTFTHYESIAFRVEGTRSWAQAELLRVAALRAQDCGEDPAPLLEQAITAARAQKAGLFELRAAVALARVRKDRGEPVAAVLQPVLDRVGDTPGLTELAEAWALSETIS